MLTYRRGQDALRGGLDMVISLTPDQVEALSGKDAVELAEALDTVLVGLAALRSGRSPVDPIGDSLKDQPVEAGLAWTEWLIYDLSRMRERVAGMMKAAIRLHKEQGGSYGELADAMGVTRATAQRRRDSVTGATPNRQERWATTCPTKEEEDHDDDIHAPRGVRGSRGRGSLGGPAVGPDPDRLDGAAE